MNGAALDSLGYGQITVLSGSTLVSTALTTGIPTGTEVVTLEAEGQNVRYRDDGQNPTPTVGMLLVANKIYTLTVAQIAAMRVIETASGAKLNVTYYGRKI